MTTLHDYLGRHAAQAADGTDVMFFKVSKGPEATADALRAAIKAHRGEFCECDPLDGNEHGYMELGGWVGDQGAALAMMGLGAALGLWRLNTPRSIFGTLIDDAQAMQMAGAGMVSIIVPPMNGTAP